MTYETLLVSVHNHIATLVINRPDKRNALNATVRREIVDALSALESLRGDDAVHVVVFTGAGDKAFVAGADIGEFAERSPIEQRAAMNDRNVFDAVAAYSRPTIAMINGYAFGGGCELALACDLRIAARSAKLGQPEIKLGILPGGGGTQRLPRLIGAGRALRMILTGDAVTAEDAERIGLVDQVSDDGDLEATVMALAAQIAAHSPVAVRLARDAVRAAFETPLTAGLAYERELFISAFSSEDRTEGVRAFLEKRAPEFKGR